MRPEHCWLNGGACVDPNGHCALPRMCAKNDTVVRPSPALPKQRIDLTFHSRYRYAPNQATPASEQPEAMRRDEQEKQSR